MRILFAASLHHPEALRAAQAAAPADPPLFPPSMAQHFWERALKRRGHTLDVFWRDQPAIDLAAWLPDRLKPTTRRHARGLTPAKLIEAARARLHPAIDPDKRARNANLIQHARRFMPDVVWMVGDNTVITPDTLAAVKRATGCTLVYACGTSPIVFSHAVDRAAARLYDLILASDYYHGVQWLELGAPRMVSLPLAACDPAFHRPYPAGNTPGADVAFVGTLVPANLYSRRVQALEVLRSFDLGIWSVHEVPPSLQAQVRGAALGEAMQRVLSASRLCFNTHGDFVHYGGNLRLFEVAGAGVAQIAEDLPGTRLWFPTLSADEAAANARTANLPDAGAGATILIYGDHDDLRSGVARLLADDAEREAMALRARAHVIAHHTYDARALRFEVLIDEIKQND